MRMVAVPYSVATCRVCGAAATRALREWSIGDCALSDWRLYCDQHGAQPGRGLSTDPSRFQKIEEVIDLRLDYN